MKSAILIACGVLATCACSTSKPADDPTQVAVAEPPATESPPPVGATGAREPDRAPNGSAPALEQPAPSSPPPAAAPPEPAAPNASNAPATLGATPPSSQPDNTRVNKRDRDSNALTPMDQGNGGSDLKITQQIRQAVMADSSLSFTAKNVKIITAKGKVTLRGPVKNDQERSAIEASARKVAGDTNVDDQIEVKK